MKNVNELQQLRSDFVPTLPRLLHNLNCIHFVPADEKYLIHPSVKQNFPLTAGQPFLKGESRAAQTLHKPLKVGVVFSGGQAAGGHNVIAGLYNALKALHTHSQLFGFLNGPSGIISGNYKELTIDTIKPYCNQGGFDLIGSGRTKIETAEQLCAALSVMNSLHLDGLVIIGGDDSSTNAAFLSEYCLKNASSIKIVSVPKTIDADLKNAYVAVSFGFDTACKVYSDLIGNIARDVLSSKKYYHFIKLMGRSASHITLECALSTQPNVALISEEVAFEKKTLKQLVELLADVVCLRADRDKHYGVFLIPEGIIEFIPEVNVLIQELNCHLASSPTISIEQLCSKLTESSRICFSSLPQEIQKQLLLNRDPHGNIHLSFIETQRLFMQMVEEELSFRKKQGSYSGDFKAVAHFFGYEGRAAFPSAFDSHYCYALGYVAALLIEQGVTGYMSAILNLTLAPLEWQIGAVPLTSLMHMQARKGVEKPVIQKALVDLQGKAFNYLRSHREKWIVEDAYLFPGPIQFFGPSSLCDSVPLSLSLENE